MRDDILQEKIAEVERRIDMGVRFRGNEFYKTETYKHLAEELVRLKQP